MQVRKEQGRLVYTRERTLWRHCKVTMNYAASPKEENQLIHQETNERIIKPSAKPTQTVAQKSPTVASKDGRFTSRHMRGPRVSLEDSDSSRKDQLLVHVNHYCGHLMIHLRKFRDGIPSKTAVTFNHASWMCLMDLVTVIDKSVHQLNKPTVLTIDSERAVAIEYGGCEQVKIIFSRGAKSIELSLKQWKRFVELRPIITGMIVDQFNELISRLDK